MENAVAKLLAVLQEQVRQTPSHAVIQHPEADADPAQEEETEKKVSYCFWSIDNETKLFHQILVFMQTF